MREMKTKGVDWDERTKGMSGVGQDERDGVGEDEGVARG